MRDYKDYVKALNAKAMVGFREYKNALFDLESAEVFRKEYPQAQSAVTAKYAALSARAQADYLEAKEKVNDIRNALKSLESEFKTMRDKLANDLDSEFAADPAKIDANTMEILKAGILSTAEYKRFYDEAVENNNRTMARIIGKYAAAAADTAEKGGKPDDAVMLRLLSAESEADPKASYLQTYDFLIDTFHRCVANPPMIDKWGELTEEITQE